MSQEPKSGQPVHLHDCEMCVYLGTIRSVWGVGGWVDLYACDALRPGLPSVLMRYDSHGPAYVSLPVNMMPHSMELTVARLVNQARLQASPAGAVAQEEGR